MLHGTWRNIGLIHTIRIRKKPKQNPVLVVEGTFGTETGNIGDAQKTKVGHVVDLAEKKHHWSNCYAKSL